MDSSLLAEVCSTHFNASYLMVFASLACMLVIIIKQCLWMTRLRRFAAKKNCTDTTEVKQFDKPFGLGFIIKMVRAYRRQTYLEWWQILAAAHGYTFSYWLLGQRIYVTADPENVKTIFSSSFEATGRQRNLCCGRGNLVSSKGTAATKFREKPNQRS